jgi:superfamily II DNA or RNA helicase
VAHAGHVAEAFRQAGYRAASIDGSLSDYERARRLQDLADGGLHVLTSCDLIDEGLDVPVATVAILLRRTCSKAKHKQQLGRVLRAHPGKRCAIVIDHVGNLLRHGPPDKPERWSLDGGCADDSSSDSDEATERALRAAGVRRLPDPVEGRLVAAEVDEWGGLRASDRQLAWGFEDLRAVRGVAA